MVMNYRLGLFQHHELNIKYFTQDLEIRLRFTIPNVHKDYPRY